MVLRAVSQEFMQSDDTMIIFVRKLVGLSSLQSDNVISLPSEGPEQWWCTTQG